MADESSGRPGLKTRVSLTEAVLPSFREGCRRSFGADEPFAPCVLIDQLAGPWIERVESLHEDPDRHLADRLLSLGRRLLRGQVSLGEAIDALGLLEESLIAAIEDADATSDTKLADIIWAGRLFQRGTVLLASTYEDLADEIDRRPRRSQDDPGSGLGREGDDRCVGLIGKSPPMWKVYDRIRLAARTRMSVLITGESGTGKELAARAIHALSGDSPDRFIPINCAAIPGDIFESELFGHRRGAFSGASTDRKGLFFAANLGTLFLDEITELSAQRQAKLLRAIQEKAVRPIGSDREEPVDVRIVASTNRNAALALDQGLLRRDLYHRLQTFTISLPPLRERPSDVELLARHFFDTWSRAVGLSTAAISHLENLPWPGNVRELQSAVWAACASCPGSLVEVSDLPDSVLTAAALPARPVSGPVSLKDAERDVIEKALVQTGGNKTQAALILGISRKQLRVKIRSYGL
ncbi:MAG: sigma-54-dependent Fis family transcriptional regulator [Candidatus Riflebacteria bacterium]|nr:sigma-54-dependent Fis family transcriptional regulator [Candidatus Riflebacteria bacterium]